MKRFNLDEYIKNPSQRVVTRDGRNVKILCTDYIGFGPIIAKVEGNDYSQMFDSDGRACRCEESNYDLFFAPEKHEGWANIYGKFLACDIFPTKEEAEEYVKRVGAKDFVATAKIEWEE